MDSEVYLTKGMGGSKIKLLGKATSAEEADKVIAAFKADPANISAYKIEQYSRMLEDKENNQVIVDFGDYCTFITITNCQFKDIIKQEPAYASI